MKKKLELLRDGKIKVTEEVVNIKEHFVESSAVSKRIDEIKIQMERLNEELDELKKMKELKDNKPIEYEL